MICDVKPRTIQRADDDSGVTRTTMMKKKRRPPGVARMTGANENVEELRP